MTPTRRDFIKHIGVALAGLMVRRCSCYTQAPLPPPTLLPSPTPHPLWVTLRNCWLDLGDPQLQTFHDTAFSSELRQRHSSILDMLISAEELSPSIAEEIDVAFNQAIDHIQRQTASCYLFTPAVFYPREDLVQQALLLEEMAAESDIDPETVATARKALERDIAWLAQFQDGQSPGTLAEIEVPSTSIEAARILVELLLGRKK